MIAKRYRLPIGLVTTRPTRVIRSGLLTLKIFSSNLPFGRFGVIAPKSSFPLAVDRTRVKRAAFDAFAPFGASLAGIDVLCLFSKKAPTETKTIRNEVSAVLSKLK